MDGAMKRVILTSSSGLCLIHANRADMVAPIIFRFVWGPLPSPSHLDGYFAGRSLRIFEETHWSDFVGRFSRADLTHKDTSLLWFCEKYGVDVIELWFDPTPNDQLQLIWALDYLRADPALAERLRLRHVDFDLLGADGAGLRTRTVRESDVTENEFEIANMAWEAYRAPTPELCFGLLSRNLSTLPFLKPALQEHLTELPSPTTGLGATEAQLLELIARGSDRTKELFQLRKPNNTRVFDQWELGTLLEELAFGPMPAVAGLDGKLAILNPDDSRARHAAFLRSRLSLTEFGEAVLAGRENFRRHNPIKRWWGGTQLTNERLWRWEAETRSLIAP
jgi:hypothetical protein